MDTWPLLESIPRLADAKSESVLQAAPAQVPGVYLLWRAGLLVYIGQSADIRRRLFQHRKEGTKPFDTATFFEIPEHSDRLRVESVLIIAALPPHNRHVTLGLAGTGSSRYAYDYGVRFPGAGRARPDAKKAAARAPRRRRKGA